MNLDEGGMMKNEFYDCITILYLVSQGSGDRL